MARFKQFTVVFLEIAYAVLQHPTELPVYLKRIPDLVQHVVVSVSLAATCSALSVYMLRDYFDGSVWIVFPLLSVLHTLCFLVGGVFFGLLADTLTRRMVPDRPQQPLQMVAVALLAMMPLAFSLPLTFPLKLIASRLGVSVVFLMLPVVLALCVWVFLIATRGLQFLYEIPLRRAVTASVQAALIVLAYPLLMAAFFALDVAQLLS